MSAARAVGFAPASIGNVAAGFDVLGLAIAGAGDRVICTRSETPGVRLVSIDGDAVAGDLDGLDCEARRNTAGIAAEAFWRHHGDGGGLELALEKGTPLASGMGSSAASAVAAVVAANALLDESRSTGELLVCALAGERFASGAEHADNVAPSLLGGLVLCPPSGLPRCDVLPVPGGLCSVLVHPALRIATADARMALATDVPLALAVRQMGLVASVVHACHTEDTALFVESLKDVLVEPQRQHLVAGFDDVRAVAVDAGALACSLSGSGPSMFAIAAAPHAQSVAVAMVECFSRLGIAARSWVSPLDAPGAHAEVLA